MIEYDLDGLPEKHYGKKRPKTPGTVICSCGLRSTKISYGLYECLCGKCHIFKFGKLVEGDVVYRSELNKKQNGFVASYIQVKYYSFGNWSTDAISMT